MNVILDARTLMASCIVPGLTLHVERVERPRRPAFGISAQGLLARAFQERGQLGEPAELIGQRHQIAGDKVILLVGNMLPTFGQHLHNAGDRHQQGVASLLGGEIGRAGVIGNQVIQRVQRLIAAATGHQLDQNIGNIIELLHRSLLAALRDWYGAPQRTKLTGEKSCVVPAGQSIVRWSASVLG